MINFPRTVALLLHQQAPSLGRNVSLFFVSGDYVTAFGCGLNRSLLAAWCGMKVG